MKRISMQLLYAILLYAAAYGQNQEKIVDQKQDNPIKLEQNMKNQDFLPQLTPEEREMMEMFQNMTPEEQQEIFKGITGELDKEVSKLSPEEQEKFWNETEKKPNVKSISNKGIIMQSNKPSVQANIGISEQNREKVGALLNRLLADEFILYIKTLNYHWNVRDTYFDAMHKFFEKLYEKQLDISDDVAERARALGVVSFGTAQEFLKNSQLKEQPGVVPTTKEMLKNLLDDHEAIIRSIRIDAEKCIEYEDMGTNNFLTELIEKHEKIAWMLRSGFERKD